MKKITVVIPCFNQGHFIDDALNSLQNCNANLFDIIIVNDGSTDEKTNERLHQLLQQGYNVIQQQNKGLGEARNTGIKLATTPYILPLDADNKILPAYIEQAILILDVQPSTAVVYGNANYFGEKKGLLKPGIFNLQRLMLGNYIDACAVIRKSVLLEVEMYDNMKIMGYEDWDLWLKIAFNNYKLHYVDEVLFEYRVSQNSMMKNVNVNIKKQNEIEDYFTQKYASKLDFEYAFNRILYQIKRKPFKFIRYIILKNCFPSYYNKLIKENRIHKNFIYG